MTAKKKEMVGGKCEQCGSMDYLQSHHIRYPADWFKTSFDDLKVLCRPCHRKAHGLYVATEFDDEFKRVMRKMLVAERHSELPDEQDLLSLASLIEDAADEWECLAAIRQAGGLRIIHASSKMYASWLKKPSEVKSRMWPWARRKLERLQNHAPVRTLVEQNR
jgi:hypothetical protein